MPPEHRSVSLKGLGPLSNPAVFRVYASCSLGALLYGHTLFIASGFWLSSVAMLVGNVVFIRQIRKWRIYHLPPQASVDGLNVAGGLAVGAAAALAHFAIADGLTLQMVGRIAGSAVIASAAFVLAAALAERRSLRAPLQPNPTPQADAANVGAKPTKAPANRGW